MIKKKRKEQPLFSFAFFLLSNQGKVGLVYLTAEPWFLSTKIELI